jgi:hypothetical protein
MRPNFLQVTTASGVVQSRRDVDHITNRRVSQIHITRPFLGTIDAKTIDEIPFLALVDYEITDPTTRLDGLICITRGTPIPGQAIVNPTTSKIENNIAHFFIILHCTIMSF